MNDSSNGQYSPNKSVRLETSVLRSDLCGYDDAYIAVKGRIRVRGNNNANRIKNTGPPEQGGRGGVSPHPKFSVDVPFFADESSKCTLFEKINQQYTRKSTGKITSKLK